MEDQDLIELLDAAEQEAEIQESEEESRQLLADLNEFARFVGAIDEPLTDEC